MQYPINPDSVSLLKKWCIINKVVLQNNFHFQQNLHKRNAARTVFRIWVLIFQRGCALRKILGIQMLWTWNPGCPAYYLQAKTDSDFLVTHSKSQAPGHSGCCYSTALSSKLKSDLRNFRWYWWFHSSC